MGRKKIVPFTQGDCDASSGLHQRHLFTIQTIRNLIEYNFDTGHKSFAPLIILGGLLTLQKLETNQGYLKETGQEANAKANFHCVLQRDAFRVARLTWIVSQLPSRTKPNKLGKISSFHIVPNPRSNESENYPTPAWTKMALLCVFSQNRQIQVSVKN